MTHRPSCLFIALLVLLVSLGLGALIVSSVTQPLPPALAPTATLPVTVLPSSTAAEATPTVQPPPTVPTATPMPERLLLTPSSTPRPPTATAEPTATETPRPTRTVVIQNG